MGFTDHEIELVALIARYHRKSPPKTSHSEYQRLADADRRTVSVCAGILRVAIALDRTHDQVVQSVLVREGEEIAELEVTPRPGADVSLELFSAEERSALLADVLDCEVRVGEVAPQS